MELEISRKERDDMEDLRVKITDGSSRKRRIEEEETSAEKGTEKQLMDKLLKVTNQMTELKNELLKLRSDVSRSEFEFGFDTQDFLSKAPLDSLMWVTENLVGKMKEKKIKFGFYFEAISLIKGTRDVGTRSCAFYNRGSRCTANCPSNWRAISRAEGPRGGWVDKLDLRLHCCTLCLESLGIIVGHPVMNCPWVLKKTWENIERLEGTKEDGRKERVEEGEEVME